MESNGQPEEFSVPIRVGQKLLKCNDNGQTDQVWTGPLDWLGWPLQLS